ncbi:hypothetical protein D3C76_1136720 [compost metagenome]
MANAEQHIQRSFVGNIELGPLDAGARRNQVRHHYLMAGTEQVLDHVRANVARATHYQIFHPHLLESAVYRRSEPSLKRAGGMISYR